MGMKGDEVIMDTHSNDTKYWNKSTRKSIANNSVNDSQQSDTQLKPFNNSNIKVVELSHIPA